MSAENSIELGVNIDHVATLRQARGTRYPDPVEAAYIAERAGADGITVHLREDRRHIQERDVWILNQTLATRMNLELAATDEMLDIAARLKPRHCCIVPERREELTTEGGLDVVGQPEAIRAACETLGEAGIDVSLFIDPDEAQIDASAAAGAPTIELHTGPYASPGTDQATELDKLIRCARYAFDLGLQVNAGHGLNYHNVGPIAAIPEIRELNIGHAIIARAVMTGLGAAVADMKTRMASARS